MAQEVTVAATYIPNWALLQEAGAEVTVRWKLGEDGIDDDGIPRMRGTGAEATAVVYVWDSGSARFEDDNGDPIPVALTPTPVQADGPYLLYVPEFDLDPTGDFLVPARQYYNVVFEINGSETPFRGWENLVVDTAPDPTTWQAILLYNRSRGPRLYSDYAYTREETNALIDDALGDALVNPMTAVGDLVRGSTVTAGVAAPARLAIGTNGYLLSVVAGLPAWVQGAVSLISDFTSSVTTLVTTLVDGSFIATALGFTPANSAALNATALTSGTVPDARFPATLPAISGANLTNLDATDLSGAVPAGSLGNVQTLAAAGFTALLLKATSLGLQEIETSNGTEAIASDTLLAYFTGTGAGTALASLPAATGSGRLILAANMDPGGGGTDIRKVDADGSDDIVLDAATVVEVEVPAGRVAFFVDVQTARWVAGFLATT